MPDRGSSTQKHEVAVDFAAKAVLQTTKEASNVRMNALCARELQKQLGIVLAEWEASFGSIDDYFQNKAERVAAAFPGAEKTDWGVCFFSPSCSLDISRFRHHHRPHPGAALKW